MAGRVLLERPNLYNHVTANTSIVIINLFTPDAQQILGMNGLACLPCGNPYCKGSSTTHKWDTYVDGWQHQHAAPSIFVDENGRSGPMDATRSKCRTCRTSFYHTNSTMLQRLENVPELLALLPFNPKWNFKDIFLHTALTSNHEYDTITRQGPSNTIDKVRKLASEACARMEKSYYKQGQLWWAQMEEMVSDEVWLTISQNEQLERAKLRGMRASH